MGSGRDAALFLKIKIYIMRILMLLCFLTLAAGLFAQDSTIVDVNIGDELTTEILDMKYVTISSVVILLLGFAQKWLFPTKVIPEVVTRIVIIAAVVGIVGFEFGLLSNIGLIVTWILPILFYEKGLSPLGLKTPKTELQKQLKQAKLVAELKSVGVDV